MNNVFEVGQRVRSKLIFIAMFSYCAVLLTYLFLWGFLFERGGLIVDQAVFCVLSSIVGLILLFILKGRKTRVELFQDRVVFGKKVFIASDVKRITVLERRLRITYGRNNTKYIYTYKGGARQDVINKLHAFSVENRISFLDVSRVETEKESLIDLEEFMEFGAPKPIVPIAETFERNQNEMLFDLEKYQTYGAKTHPFLIIPPKKTLRTLLVVPAIFGMTILLYALSGIATGIIVYAMACISIYPKDGLLAQCIFIGLVAIILALRSFSVREIEGNCMEQKQYFEGDTLKVEIFGKKNTFKKYSIPKQSIEKVLANDQYIEVHGYIDCEIHSSEGIDKSVIDCVQIPRCFANEEQILNLM